MFFFNDFLINVFIYFFFGMGGRGVGGFLKQIVISSAGLGGPGRVRSLRRPLCRRQPLGCTIGARELYSGPRTPCLAPAKNFFSDSRV